MWNSLKLKFSFMCTFGLLSNITNHLTCYDSKKVWNPENTWMRDCKLTKLSCSTRWLGNESMHAELRGSKAHWYSPEFIYRHVKIDCMVQSQEVYFTQTSTIWGRLSHVGNIVFLTFCRAQQFLQWSNQLLSELFKGWD